MFRIIPTIFGFFIIILSFFVTSRVLDYYWPPEQPGPRCSTDPDCCPKGQIIGLTPPFLQMEGYAYRVPLPKLANIADTATNLARSPAVLCESDYRTGPGHRPYAEIIEKGYGRFMHYEDDLVFSSSDNSNPNSNGRRYTVVIPSK
jgi:hypothetical protein